MGIHPWALGLHLDDDSGGDLRVNKDPEIVNQPLSGFAVRQTVPSDGGGHLARCLLNYGDRGNGLGS
jgi:hypothetical protein